MATVKASANCPDVNTANALLAQARTAAANWSTKPERETTIDYDPLVSPTTIRVKALTTTDQEGRRVFNAVENAMVNANVQSGSFVRSTNADGSLGSYREW